MSSGMINAGLLPAFMDFSKLGSGYALMTRQVETGRLLHAYLFTGPRGVGKATFARFLAASLFCEDASKPCGVCDACNRVFTRNEPDVMEVHAAGDKAISVDLIRETIAAISQHAYGGIRRIVIIEPFEKLTPAAQNCLLKSLEEPPANVVFFLLSHEPSALLGTIASRCAMIKLTPWPDVVMRQTLLRLGFDQEHADAVLPRASGNIGQAVDMLKNETGEDALNQLVRAALTVSTDADVVSLSTRMKEDRDSAERTLAGLEQSLHQALLVRTGILSAQSVLEPCIRSWATQSSTEDLTDLLQTLFETRKRRLSQVNWQAGIDHLLMKISEAKTRWQQS